MPKRTAFGVVLKQQAASAFAEYQDGDAPPAQNGPQLAVPVLPPPHAPPPIVYPWAMPGSSQQKPSQQESSGVDLATIIEEALESADAATAAGPSNSGQAQEDQDADARSRGLMTRRPCPRIRATLRSALRTLINELPESAKGSVQPVGGPAEGM